jgi:hypothetical protein
VANDKDVTLNALLCAHVGMFTYVNFLKCKLEYRFNNFREKVKVKCTPERGPYGPQGE